jgi:hypothetical protein
LCLFYNIPKLSLCCIFGQHSDRYNFLVYFWLLSIPFRHLVNSFFCLTICHKIHTYSFFTVMFKISSFVVIICFWMGRGDSNPTALPFLPHLPKPKAALVFHHLNSSFFTF